MEKDSIRDKLKWITWPLIILSFIVGTGSFMYAGCNFPDAFYNCFALLQFQVPNGIEMNIGLEIIRWIAPCSFWAGVLIEIKPIFSFIRDGIVFRISKCIIYSDSEIGQAIYDNLGNSKEKNKARALLLDGKKAFRKEKKAKTIMIIMNEDADAFRIYRRLMESNRKEEPAIYLCLNTLEPNLIPSTGKITLFNTNDLVAGAFWDNDFRLKEYYSGKDINIVISGYGMLGRRLVYKGFLLNLFSLKQKIIYHIIEEKPIDKTHKDELFRCCSMLQDEVHFYESMEECEVIHRADALIFTEKTEPGELQKWLYATERTKVFYYDPDGMGLEDSLQIIKDGKINELLSKPFERLKGYGINKRVFRYDKLTRNKLNGSAVAYYKWYLSKYHPNRPQNDEWNKLPGFKKGLYLNQLDYAKVGILDDLSTEELSELGHIHWCRYYYLNHWVYGTKDSERRRHEKLVSYKELSPEARKKNEEIISCLKTKGWM